MNRQTLMEIGLRENEITELTGKWIAVLLHNEKSGDPEIMKENGLIIASENLIDVQLKAGEIYPNFSGIRNPKGKYVQFCFISKKLDFKY